jgi:ubiquinone/menaquinone biosynthesis C-methylase UbiE
MHKTVRKVLRAVANYDPDYYDMYDDAHEAFFAQLYLERITQHARLAGIQPPATLLEAGCQAGRLAIPLARLGFRVTGIDTSGFGLRRAQAHAKAAGVDATWIRGDLLTVLARDPSRQYDVVVCAEVLYLSPRYREMLRALVRALRPGGLLCVSYRPKFYYLLEALRQYDGTTAARVLRQREGRFRDSEYFNWHTEEELRALYRSLGLQWHAMYPIDRFVWLSGANLSQLSEAQRAQWLELELTAEGVADTCARYLLVIASTPMASSRSA